MFCKFCGAKIDDNAEICEACASKEKAAAQQQEKAPVQEPAQETAQPAPQSQDKQKEHQPEHAAPAKNPYVQINTEEIKKGMATAAGKAADKAKEAAEVAKVAAGAAKSAIESKDKNKKNFIIAAAAAVVVIAIILVAALSTPAYEKPVEYFITGLSKGSYKTLKKAMPKYVIDELEDGYFDLEDMLEEMHDEMIDEYGRNVKITYKVKRKKSIDKDDLEDIEDMIDRNFDEDVKVSKGYELRVEMRLKAKGESDKEKIDINVYKIDGKWYLLSIPF
ncbi:MAG: zinc ribbon domain-containing protein [Huintestinicola sp.]